MIAFLWSNWILSHQDIGNFFKRFIGRFEETSLGVQTWGSRKPEGSISWPGLIPPVEEAPVRDWHVYQHFLASHPLPLLISLSSVVINMVLPSVFVPSFYPLQDRREQM